MALDRFNPALRWFAALCLAGFIFGGCMMYILPHDLHPAKHDLHPAKGDEVSLAAITPGSSSSPPSQRLLPDAPAPTSQPPAAPQAVAVQSTDADPLPPQPDPPRINAILAQPAEPSKPIEKVRACVVGDPELRDLFITDLLQSMTGKIVSGNCSSVEGPIVTVSGVASKLVTSDPACRTVDGHLYEVFVSISRPGSHADISRTVFATRCASRIRNEDLVLGREAKDQAVLQGIVSLRGLLQRLSEN